MYALLGEVVFSNQFGFDAFSRTGSANLVEHAKIDNKPRLQKVGDNLDEITFDMQLHSSFCEPKDEIERLRTYKSNGDILPFTTGEGSYLGQFAIAEVAETILHTLPDGYIVHARVSVTLKESVTTGQDLEQQEAKLSGFANSANSPLLTLAPVPYNGPGGGAMNALANANSSVAIANVSLAQASQRPSAETHLMGKAQTFIKDAKSNLDEFQERVQSARDLVANYEQLVENAEDAKTFANNALAAIQNGDLDGAIDAGNNAQNSLNSIYGASANVAVLTAARRI